MSSKANAPTVPWNEPDIEAPQAESNAEPTLAVQQTVSQSPEKENNISNLLPVKPQPPAPSGKSPKKAPSKTNTTTPDTDKDTPKSANLRRWFGVILVIVVIVTTIAVVVPKGTNDSRDSDTSIPQNEGDSEAAIPDMDELVELLSTRSPESSTMLLDPTTPQNRAMAWLAIDAKMNSFALPQDEDRIVQRAALAIFKFSMAVDRSSPLQQAQQRSTRNPWLHFNTSECDWEGISCSPEGKVNALVRENQYVGGTIPLELSLVDQLETLNLGLNEIDGSIPTELSKLTLLESLWLDGNRLKGSLPSELGLLTDLETLHLEDNSLVGTVPSELGVLNNLRDFHLESNLLEGQVPDEVCELDELTNLVVDCAAPSPKIECDCCTLCTR